MSMSMRRLLLSNNQRICSSLFQKTRNFSAISSSHSIISPPKNPNPIFSSSSLFLKEFRRPKTSNQRSLSVRGADESMNEKKEGSRISYISGARLVHDKKVKIALTQIDGIGPRKAVQVCYRLGISDNIKVKELTKYQIDQIEQMISEDHVVHWELKRGERADIERLISISCYRGIRHQGGLPLRGQRTHTNARTCKKKTKK